MSFDFDVVRLQGIEEYGAFEASPEMQATGWNGGLWIRYKRVRAWRDGSSIRVSRIVEPCDHSDPMMFILRGSYEPMDQYTSHYPQKTPGVTCCLYGQFLFKYYEKFNLAERTVPGSGAPLAYHLNDDIWVSDNGLLTSEKEYPNSRSIGHIVAEPADNDDYVGVEVLIGPT